MAIAVVTGSSSGIGRATAIRLAQCGYSVLLHARENLSGLQDTAREIQLCNGQTRCVTADIRSAAACQALVDAAFAWEGQVAVWVNNAGADILTGSASSLSFEERLEMLWQVDVLGTVRLSRLVVSRMAVASQQPARATQKQNTQLEQEMAGRLPTVINLSWDQAPLGMEGDPGQLFGTTKSAVAAFTQSLALSVAGIRVNCVAPGWIRTEWAREAAHPRWSQRAISESLLHRWGTPEDVAEAICWLAGSGSQFVNGQTLNVNGGRRFHAP